MSAHRTLPTRPSLEFERKEAKSLLKRLHAGDAAALVRARERESALMETAPEDFRLADAQLILAREYGFTSWPRLVHYFEGLEQQQLGRRWERSGGSGANTMQARQFMRLHHERKLWAARVFAAFVPRYYGLKPEEVFAVPPTESEAQLAYARFHGAPDWDSLNTQDVLTGDFRERLRDEVVALIDPLDALDFDRFKRAIVEHKALLRLDSPTSSNRMSLPRMILQRERRHGREAMAPFVDWLKENGFDVQRELNEMLAGRKKIGVDQIQWLLDRGADPNWVAPNGIPILEHALLIHWDPVTVDLIASRAEPRNALWIAAGLGDVDGVSRSLDERGHPLPEAVKLRPPFDAVGADSLASHPEPDEEELLMEALFVAAINGRLKVIEYLGSRGVPLDSLVYGSPLINVAVGNGWADVTESLIQAGASVDIRGTMPDQTAREMAREYATGHPDEPARQRIRELCDLAPRPGAR